MLYAAQAGGSPTYDAGLQHFFRASLPTLNGASSKLADQELPTGSIQVLEQAPARIPPLT